MHIKLPNIFHIQIHFVFINNYLLVLNILVKNNTDYNLSVPKVKQHHLMLYLKLTIV